MPAVSQHPAVCGVFRPALDLPVTGADSEYSESIRLEPTTSVSTRRYGKNAYVNTFHATIDPGQFVCNRPASSGLDPTWSVHIHPEGQRYFCREGSGIRVVTEANMYDAEVTRQISFWLKYVEESLSHNQLAIPETAELFLELGDSPNTCGYHFVDHAAKTQFWLEPLSTEPLNMAPVVSEMHLKTALERLYWVHVELFPMHLGTRLSPRIVEDLIGVISHGQADRMTSPTSTFPYTVDQCSKFLNLLNLRRGQDLDGYTLCFVARLWGSITNARFATYYGEEYAQLDRLQAMLPSDEVEYPWLSLVASWTCWGIPDLHLSRLRELFVDNRVFVDQWCLFMSSCVVDWNTSLVWTFPVLTASIGLSFLPGASLFSALPSIFSCCASITSGSILLLRHQGLAEATAPTAALYLRAAKSSAFGFLPSAVAFSLPRAFYLWGVGFLAAQFMFILSHLVSKVAMIGAVGLMVAVVCLILWATAPETHEEQTLLGRLLSHCPILKTTVATAYEMV
ncbi:hypothetical protein BV22DRAFT_1069923 [Leucogyrophana mollusca]|uniref:Uncharacterized protein n=1 Tax=Leucogyrophana mollusca TaxID=85980 RepID=A0ACB8BAP6_9AGAM|nr:hypothetical protein BV22DRAFT_1069923 [Leucogyrophana mollusca]